MAIILYYSLRADSFDKQVCTNYRHIFDFATLPVVNMKTLQKINTKQACAVRMFINSKKALDKKNYITMLLTNLRQYAELPS